jgi:RNA polymerase sigma-70 factor (ECF subfamily)
MTDTPDPLSPLLARYTAQFEPLFRSLVRKYGLEPAEYDELVQDVRIRLWRAQGSSEQVSAVSTSYVWRTAMAAAIDLLRRRRTLRETTMAHGADVSLMPASRASAPDRVTEHGDLVARVAAAVEELPEARRVAVRMHLTGYPREEIGRMLGWTEAKTRNLIYRGLTDVRTRLTAQGIRPDEGAA